MAILIKQRRIVEEPSPPPDLVVLQPTDDPAAQRAQFHRVWEIYDHIRAAGIPLDTLSMGMSHDLEAAVAEGATIVRIGTAIFGERSYT